MKQKLLILLAALMAAVSAHAFQYTHEGQTLSYSKTSSTTCELTNYKANDNNGDIIIPDVVTYNNQEYTVTSIAENCFKNYAGLSSIDVPETITCIGNSAFYGCVGLTNVVIPNSVTTLGESVFYGCTGLTGVTLPNAVDEIKDYTFYGCSNLQSIELPDSITKIGKEAFNSCLTLKSITIPETVTSVGQSAFGSSTSLESITVKIEDPYEIKFSTMNNVPGEDPFVFYGVDKQHCYLYVPKGSEDLYAEAPVWKDFMKINYRVLNDGEAYHAEEDVEEPNVDYIREFKNTNWQPLYLPFAMNYDEWAPYADVAELYNVRGYDPDNDGEIDEVTIEFNRLKEGASIQPNIPYVIKAKETGKVTFECKDKLVTAAPAAEGMVECSSTKFTYAFHGIYEEKTDLFSTGAYFLSKGDFYQAANENVKLAPYRAYLTVTQKTGGYNGDTTPAKAPQRITLVVDGEEETEGIEDIIDIAPLDDVYYDLMGRKVVNPTSGIYIQNGRKVYIK